MSELVLSAAFVVLVTGTVTIFLNHDKYPGLTRESWNRLSIGLSLLCVATAVPLFQLLSPANSLGLPGDNLPALIAVAISLLGGALSTASGLALWVPRLLKSASRYDKFEELAELTSKIEPVGHSNLSSGDIVKEASEHLFETVKPRQLVYFEWNHTTETLDPVVSHPIECNALQLPLSEIEDVDWLREAVVDISAGRSHGTGALSDRYSDSSLRWASGRIAVSIPVCSGERLLGVVVMTFDDEDSIYAGYIDVMMSAARMIGNALEKSALRDDIVNIVCLSDAHARLNRLAIEADDLTDLMTTGGALLKMFVPYDMLSVSVLDPNITMMRRYSVTESGNRVSEKGLSLPIDDTFVKHVATTRKHEIQTSLSGIKYRDDAWLSKCGFDARLSLPILINNRVVGVLSFLSLTAEKYSTGSAKHADLLADVFSVAISNQLAREKYVLHVQRVANLRELYKSAISESDSNEFLSKFAEKVTALMPMTYCRLSLLSNRRRSLVLLHDHSRRSNTGIARTGERQIHLDSAPIHLRAIEAGEAIVMNLDDADQVVSPEELTMSFPEGVKSILLVPLQIEGEVRGIMSLGEMRGWDRCPISDRDVAFAEMIGTCGSLALKIADHPTAGTLPGRFDFDSRRAATALPSLYYNRRLSGPLSSIVGAAELMERNLPETDSPLMMCVRTIRRNAYSAMKAFNDFREYENSAR
ncbi:MAG: GAF domain-containing protein [Candidatus Zixiibacteriota bacterium]